MNRLRDLLFGALSLQHDLIDAGQFADACDEWMGQADGSLADLLVERGWLSAEDRDRVEDKVRRRERWAVATTEVAVALPRLRSAGATVADAGPCPPTADVWLAETEADRADGFTLVASLADAPRARRRYRDGRRHAKGGLGVVWLARDEHMGRDVALKELRADRADEAAHVARFLAEARITGQLEHPAIVPVYELADGSDGGRPFYTMRFIGGRTLAKAVREYHLDRALGGADRLKLAELLNAFVGVCNALAYAHSRGVIHRDLKGSNVVLGDFGEVVVLDWGLAKLVDSDDPTIEPVSLDESHEGGETVAGAVMGTPAYMSPEQAEGRPDLMDRLCDVYGLGAILYEILTGRPPFPGDDSKAIIQKALHDEPPRPRQVNPDVPRALEAICRKAMARDRNARYASAAALADDVKRWLADEPVLAFDDPWPVRLRRRARRNRTAVVGAAALLVTALVGLSASTVLIDRERQHAVTARKVAEENFRLARRAVEEMLTRVANDRLALVPQAEPLRRELIDAAAGFYAEFLRRGGSDPEVRKEAAQVHRLAAYFADLADHTGDAERDYDRAVEILDGLVAEYPEMPEYRDRLATTATDAGNSLIRLGRPRDGETLGRRALELAEGLRAEAPRMENYRRTEARALDLLALAQDIGGRPGEARASIARAVALLTPLADRRALASDPVWLQLALFHRGTIEHRAGDIPAALASLDEVIRRGRAELSRSPGDYSSRAVLANALAERATLLGDRPDRREDAERVFDEAVSHWTKLTGAYPENQNYRLLRATALIGRGGVRIDGGRPEAGEPDLTEARTVLEDVARRSPDSPDAHGQLARALAKIARLERGRGRHEAARTLLEEAIRRQDRVLKSYPDAPHERAALADYRAELARSRGEGR